MAIALGSTAISSDREAPSAITKIPASLRGMAFPRFPDFPKILSGLEPSLGSEAING